MWTTKENTRKELERVIRTEEDTKRRSVRRTGTKIRSDAKNTETLENRTNTKDNRQNIVCFCLYHKRPALALRPAIKPV